MVNVAILGFGTVGSGVAEVLTKNGGLIDQRVDDLVRLKYILDVRDFPDSPYADCFVKDFSVIEQDPEVNIVVETIGGATIALDFTTRALKAGKSVVTSNKELVATHGHDACRKICILAALAFGQHVYPQQVPTEGIRNVTLEDVAYADSKGYKIKLLGRCIREPEGKVCAFVAPHLVSDENPLAGVEDVFNAIAVTGNAIGDVMFYGRGAGKLPTASAVVADVIDIAKDLKKDRHNAWGPGAPDLVVSPDILSSRWYVRANASMDQARLACGEIQPLARAGAPAGEAAFLTGQMTHPQIRDCLKGMAVSSLFRVLE